MSSELFERCIAEAATVAENVYFHVLGEPTLHPGFGLFLKKLEETPLKLNLTTNGTTIARTGKQILRLLQRTCRETGTTVVVITHNQALAGMADRIITMRSGRVVQIAVNEHPVSVDLLEW